MKKDDTQMKTVPIKTEKPDQHTAPPGRWSHTALKILLPLFIVLLAIAGAAYISTTTPTARKKQPAKEVPLVQIEAVHQSGETVVVSAMGTVIPAREIDLKSRVSGEIVSIHPYFTEGGVLEQGTRLLQIDPEDYRLAVEEQQSQLADATYELKLELGQQKVAQREWELLNGEKQTPVRDDELALRKPHLEKAKANLAAAQAALTQARLNLERTAVRAPFNAIVRTKYVDRGSQVSISDQLAELVGTDEYRIQVSIPIDRLKWIRIPDGNGEEGSRVLIIWGNRSYERTGTVVKLLGDLETQGRMARVLVSVNDPLGLRDSKTERPPLLIGQYVRVDIRGSKLDDVVRIPRAALRNNRQVWIYGNDGRLLIREVGIAWRDKETVFVKTGLKEGDKLILSDLATPVNGMNLRVSQPSDNVSKPGAVEVKGGKSFD